MWKTNIRKVVESLYIFVETHDEVEKYVKMMQSSSPNNWVNHNNIEILNLFNPESQLINTKCMIQSRLKELLSELKKFKFQTILVLEYKKRNDHKNFHSSPKLIACDSDFFLFS